MVSTPMPPERTLKKERLGKTARPRTKATSAAADAKASNKTDRDRSARLRAPKSASVDYIPPAVRRAVCERDGNQCAFVDADGVHRQEIHTRRSVRRALGGFAGGERNAPPTVELLIRHALATLT
jgi:hypothetical protein